MFILYLIVINIYRYQCPMFFTLAMPVFHRLCDKGRPIVGKFVYSKLPSEFN